MWRTILSHWEVRNKALHGDTLPENEATKRACIHPIIRALSARIHKLNPDNQVMFQKPIDERLQQPLSILTTWLSVVNPAFNNSRIHHESYSDCDSDPEYDLPPTSPDSQSDAELSNDTDLPTPGD